MQNDRFMIVPGGAPEYMPPDMRARPPFVTGRAIYQFNDANAGDFHNTGETMGLNVTPPIITPTAYFMLRGTMTQQKPAGVAGYVPNLLNGKV